MSVPGIGPIISSAVVAAIGRGEVFPKGHDFGAWLAARGDPNQSLQPAFPG
jgi:transposase